MSNVLPRDFFNRPAEEVAQDMLGTILVRQHDATILRGVITEVEAYVGPHDLACHAAKGRTKRTEVMFGPAGTLYVYLVYGMHWMLNVVTGDEGYPAAVLIRGVNTVSGPARLTKHFSIHGDLNGVPATKKHGLWLESGTAPQHIVRTPRIGIEYAGEYWASKKLRFLSG